MHQIKQALIFFNAPSRCYVWLFN